jgi:glyoxylase-like metal-dependent hydrolase (beta-lactamase superfamily II)
MTALKISSLNRRAFFAFAAAGAAGATLSPIEARKALAKEAMKDDKSAAWYRFPLGDAEVTVVSDGVLALGPISGLYPKVPKDEIEAFVKARFQAPDMTVFQENSLVFNTGDKLILFDSGIGGSKAFGPGAGRLQTTLASAGIKPEDVDAIILTHGHIDHLSGIMSADAKRLFPNAQLMMAKTEFDFWTDEAKTSATGVFKMLVDAARANLLPNKDRLEMVENGKEAVKGVQAVFTPGHTPGHTSYVLNAGGKSLLLTGDAVSHTAISFRHPDWAFSFDADPAGAVASRKNLLDMAVADNLPIIGYHFPFPGIGNVAKDGEAFRFVASPMTL